VQAFIRPLSSEAVKVPVARTLIPSLSVWPDTGQLRPEYALTVRMSLPTRSVATIIVDCLEASYRVPKQTCPVLPTEQVEKNLHELISKFLVRVPPVRVLLIDATKARASLPRPAAPVRPRATPEVATFALML